MGREREGKKGEEGEQGWERVRGVEAIADEDAHGKRICLKSSKHGRRQETAGRSREKGSREEQEGV